MTPELALTPRRPRLPALKEAICILLLAMLLPLFFVTVPLDWSARWAPALSNLGHIFFFALLTLLIHSRRPLVQPRHWLAITAAVLALSFVIELIQAKIGRTASLADVLRNLLGTWLVIAWQRSITWPARLLPSTLLIAELLWLSLVGFQSYRAIQQFPVLSTLETAVDLRRWQPVNSRLSQSSAISSEGKYALRADLLPGDFSGVVLQRFPGDWQDYSLLHIDLYNPQSDALPITLRIHDRQHQSGQQAWRYDDRFNRSLTLQSGWNQIAIPLQDIQAAPTSRPMDLGEIQELQVFVADSKKPKVIYVDNLRLTVD